MRDPYLRKDADVLDNLLGILDSNELRTAEANLTKLSMVSAYQMRCVAFNEKALQMIHQRIFGSLYDWAGEYRTIQMIKPEEVLGGDTVRYAYPSEIKQQLKAAMKELQQLDRSKLGDREFVFRLVRIIAQIWQIHPFREGNTRTVITFAVLFAQSTGFDVQKELFKEHANYVRNSLVWASQGMYSKYEYLERIFFDAILHQSPDDVLKPETHDNDYSLIEGYKVKDYKEQPHIYIKK